MAQDRPRNGQNEQERYAVNRRNNGHHPRSIEQKSAGLRSRAGASLGQQHTASTSPLDAESSVGTDTEYYAGKNIPADVRGSEASQVLPGVWQYAPGLITTTLQNLLNWGRQNSLWYMLFATACCGIELMAFGASKFDADRHGMVPWASPRQSDLMIVAGTINEKMAEDTARLYHQMAEPRYVIAMGACASSGGPFWQGYNVVDGVDRVIPVDVYVPGCPPRPEALLDSVYKLRAKIGAVKYTRPNTELTTGART